MEKMFCGATRKYGIHKHFNVHVSNENFGEVEVCEMHYEENVVPNNFNVIPGQSLLLVVTHTPGRGYIKVI